MENPKPPGEREAKVTWRNGAESMGITFVEYYSALDNEDAEEGTVDIGGLSMGLGVWPTDEDQKRFRRLDPYERDFGKYDWRVREELASDRDYHESAFGGGFASYSGLGGGFGNFSGGSDTRWDLRTWLARRQRGI